MSGQPQAGQPAVPVSSPRAEPLRATAIGISIKEICGVRDHATLLAEALGRENVSCSLHWLQRSGGSLSAARSEIGAWAGGLQDEFEETGAEAVLLHYSVFAYSYRGIPLFVGPVLAAARRAGMPVVTILHEFVFPWNMSGLEGKVWAVSQRMRLIGVIRASAAVVVTTGQRAKWLESKRWLAKRPVAVAPVFSNLPLADGAPPRGQEAGGEREDAMVGGWEDAEAGEMGDRRIGLFGYSYDEATVAKIIGALKLLGERDLDARLVLLGAPGADSPTGARWRRRARAEGVDEALTFSGTLSAQELADRLAGCQILLFADPAGPTSRKTTLAASLVSGRPVVALDGPRRWAELIDAEAAWVVAPNGEALADAVQALMADERLRESLGQRGWDFGESQGIERSASVVAELLRECVGTPALQG
jgi:glycosyltransferase involved in cell wall biosynthesis